jgi:cold-inducible RNA-binding protein
VKVYVGNLPFSMGDDELRQLFETHGTVNSANVIMDRDTGRSRGFGFVEMADDTTAKTAIEALSEHVTGGRPLVVNEAKPRTQDGRSSDGGRPQRRW